LKATAEQALGMKIHGQAQGSNALAQLIASGNIKPDIFISVTPGPMRAVIRAGKAVIAQPIARTEMVIAYSPRSRFAPALARAARMSAAGTQNTADLPDRGASAAQAWWKILQSPGLRFGRTDPVTDPQGRNIIFTLMLAARHYGQPDLVERIIGPVLNPQQIFSEPTVQARLQSGELDAASAYKLQPGPFGLPYITLPPEINLGGTNLTHLPDLRLTIAGRSYSPEPLIYYAAVIKGGRNEQDAARYLEWLRGEAAQKILEQANYDRASDASPLTA
jgi:molybdate/tungstate transport system substrate-binding protein